MRRVVAQSVVLGLLIAACGGSSDGGSTSEPQGSGALTTGVEQTQTTAPGTTPGVIIDSLEERDPCSLLTANEVSAALGEEADDGRYQYTPPLHTCVWGSTSRQLHLRVWYWDDPAEAASSFAEWTGDIVEVPDVGDDAITSDQVDLAFLTGNIEVGIDLSAADDPAADKAAALQLGLLLLDRLP